MIHSIDEFVAAWGAEAATTARHLEALTDASLSQAVADDHRTLGRIAWHIVQTIPEMMGKTGLKPAGPGEKDPVPSTAREILDAYRETGASLLDRIRAEWSDASLQIEDDMYGEKWKRGFTLDALIAHEIHHRGQMTVLMRQAGLKVPATYGPSKEDWANYGMEPPAI